MSETVVYGCDWCSEIVDKDRDGKPKYAAKVTTSEPTGALPWPAPVEEDICGDCYKALGALREGRYRRG